MLYDTLLLDADGTLLDFDACEEVALHYTFAQNGLPYDREIKRVYQRYNDALWEQFERGEVSKEQLQQLRFARTLQHLQLPGDPKTLNRLFMQKLGQGGFTIPGAEEVLSALYGKVRMVVVTNGITATQHSRMQRSGLLPYIDRTFVSDETGSQKPHRQFFDYVFEHLPQLDPARTLMVGDTLHADMLGGQQAGLDTCWYEPTGCKSDEGLKITYRIANLCDLLTIVLSEEHAYKIR